MKIREMRNEQSMSKRRSHFMSAELSARCFKNERWVERFGNLTHFLLFERWWAGAEIWAPLFWWATHTLKMRIDKTAMIPRKILTMIIEPSKFVFFCFVDCILNFINGPTCKSSGFDRIPHFLFRNKSIPIFIGSFKSFLQFSLHLFKFMFYEWNDIFAKF